MRLTRGIPDQPLYTAPRLVTNANASPRALVKIDDTESPRSCVSSILLNEFPPSRDNHT